MPFFSKTRPSIPERHWSHSQLYRYESQDEDDSSDCQERRLHSRSSTSVPVTRASSRVRPANCKQFSLYKPLKLQSETLLTSLKNPKVQYNKTDDLNDNDHDIHIPYKVDVALFERSDIPHNGKTQTEGVASSEAEPTPLSAILSAATLRVVSGRDRGASVSTVKTAHTDLTTATSAFTDDELPEGNAISRFSNQNSARKIATRQYTFDSDDDDGAGPDVSNINDCDFITPCHAKDFTRGSPCIKSSGIWSKVKGIAPSMSRSKTYC